MAQIFQMPILYHGPRGKIGLDEDVILNDDNVIVIQTRNDNQDQYRFTEAQLEEMLRRIRVKRRSRILTELYHAILGA